MTRAQIFRPLSGIVVTILLALVVLVSVVPAIVAGDVDTVRRFGVAFTTVTYVSWLVLWWPSVTLSPDGVVVRNPLRTTGIDWAAITGIDGRYSLIFRTIDGAITAWSAPVARRRPPLSARWSGATDDTRPDSLQIAVERELARRADLDAPVSPARVTRRWNGVTIVPAIVLVIASVISAVL